MKLNKLPLIVASVHCLGVLAIFAWGWFTDHPLFAGYILFFLDFPLSPVFYSVVLNLFQSSNSDLAIACANYCILISHAILGSAWFYLLASVLAKIGRKRVSSKT